MKPNSGKSRTIIIKLNSAWSARMLFSKAYKLKDYSSAVFLSKSLTKTGQELERTLLKKRFKLSESGHDKSLIKIRDLKLYLDGQEVPINSNEDWLYSELFIVSLNCQSLVSLNRRLQVVNLLNPWSCGIFCASETWLNDSTESNHVFPFSAYFVIARYDRSNGEHGVLL